MSEQKAAQDDWVYFRDGWLCFHRPPKSVQRTPKQFCGPRQRWLFERSRERYDASEELGVRIKDFASSAWREQRAALTRGRDGSYT